MSIYTKISEFYKDLEEANNNWLLVAVIIISIISLIPPWVHYDIIAEDGAFHYSPIARMYLDGNFLKALSWELPIYPFLLASFSYITGFNIELAGRILSAFFYVLSSVGIFKITQSVFKSQTSALISVVLLITNRDLMDLGVDCLKETMVLCIIIWASYYWLLSINHTRNLLYLMVSICIFTIGCFVRSTSAFFFLSCFISWLIHEKKWKIIYILISCTIIFAGFIYYSINIDYEFLRNYNPRGLEINDKIFYQTFKYLECYFTAGNPIAVILAFIGVILFFKQNIYAKFVAVVFFISMTIFSMRYYISDRYMMPMIMMIYPISANLVTKCISSQKYILKAVGIIAVLYSLAQWGDLALKKPEPRRLAIRQAGEWIYHNYGSDISVSSNQSRVIFYAGIQTPIETRKSLDKIDLEHPSEIIAVDVSKDDGKEIKEAVEATGGTLVKEIPPIFIFSLR